MSKDLLRSWFGCRFSPRHFMVAGLILGFLAGLCLGQVSAGGRPYSSDAAKSIAATPLAGVRLPAPDVPALLVEDKLEEARGLPFRFGAPQPVDIGLETAGEWQELPEGGYLWRLRIDCPGAYSINLIYDDFWLPRGARFFVYDIDRTTVLGAFTAANNLAHGKFATAPTRGPACVLEYEEPAGVDRIGRIHVSHVVHGYKDVFFNEKGYGGTGLYSNRPMLATRTRSPATATAYGYRPTPVEPTTRRCPVSMTARRKLVTSAA